MIQIIHIEGTRKGDIEDFNQKSITVGRNPACDVVFPADSVYIARHHAKISHVDGEYVFTNYGRNGSAVNGIRVESTFLRNGDVITFSVGGPKVSFLCKKRRDVATNSTSVLESTSDFHNTALNDATAEFTLQFGSFIKSFDKLSVSIGQHIENDFPISHSAVADYHAKIIYLHKNYYIKDLNNYPRVMINKTVSSPDRILCVDDIISLTDTGPDLRYLGEGKFSEYYTKKIEI